MVLAEWESGIAGTDRESARSPCAQGARRGAREGIPDVLANRPSILVLVSVWLKYHFAARITFKGSRLALNIRVILEMCQTKARVGKEWTTVNARSSQTVKLQIEFKLVRVSGHRGRFPRSLLLNAKLGVWAGL